jgi:pSer/pThr/pTyr-binding forkhead associated (FHA) protein
MRLILEVMSGPKAGQRIAAQAGQVVRIGRTSKAAVAMEDTFMSGQHFAIECVGGACGVRDLESTNGTKLNDKKITRAVLHEGDKIHAGQTEFLVHIELDETLTDSAPPGELKVTLPPTLPPEPNEKPGSGGLPASSKQKAARPSPSAELSPPTVEFQPLNEALRANSKDSGRGNHPAGASRVSSSLEDPMSAYEAATPQGSLLRLLQRQPERLMALVDATRDKHLLDLLKKSGEEFQSLYRDDQTLAIAPLLVRLPPQSALLKQMIDEGWGRGWGVYLTCKASLAELREYFRSALMVRMPDGMEMFSRFYDPRFFRSLLETCAAEEAERCFGPVHAYLMESDRSEILLEFTRGKRGVEKKGHLLSSLE